MTVHTVYHSVHCMFMSIAQIRWFNCKWSWFFVLSFEFQIWFTYSLIYYILLHVHWLSMRMTYFCFLVVMDLNQKINVWSVIMHMEWQRKECLFQERCYNAFFLQSHCLIISTWKFIFYQVDWLFLYLI